MEANPKQGVGLERLRLPRLLPFPFCVPALPSILVEGWGWKGNSSETEGEYLPQEGFWQLSKQNAGEMNLKCLSAFQIFPNKALETMKNCTKMRNELLTEIYEKHKVGNGAEETAS